MRTVGIIPARLESSRLPRKLLLAETGKPLIQYTWEAACRSMRIDEVIVAADSPEIVDAVRAFGGRCELTGDHPSGTDRIAEIAKRCCEHADLLLNIQGDEPELDPSAIDRLIELMLASPKPEMATLATPILDEQQLADSSCTKVVCAEDGRALYFSRCPIPHCRDRQPADVIANGESPWKLHLGIYAYRRDFLLEFTERPPSPLEKLEKLEQLRALEMGAAIRVGIVQHSAAGIDTPDDYRKFVARQSGSQRPAA
ncbi:MAG: 3-deoxy-manno-octulosonate cytidylyltransferase [Planctomycetota bacterium]|nr:3-deoxy-manno-octulosonate cytidylyltransferase [Planctomycetota bacterium]